MIVILLFCLVQAGNMIMSLVNSGKDVTEVLVENEETEKNAKEDPEPNEWYAVFHQDIFTFHFSYLDNRLNLLDVIASKSFLAQPETPPPNPA